VRAGTGLALLLLLPASLTAQAAKAPASELETLQERARALLAENRRAEAVVELREAARRGPLDRDLALELAGVELAQGNPNLAEQQLRSAAERFGSVRALLQLARLRASRGDADGAMQARDGARAAAPNSEEVLSAHAQVFLAARTPLPAILALEPLTRMCPSVAQYHYLFGVALLQIGDTPAAVEALREAQRLEPDRALTLVGLGLALNNQKLYAEARERLLRSLELEPDNVDAAAALAEAEDGLGDTASAEAHAQRALSRNPANPTANLVLGMLRIKQERYPEAREALERAVAAEPTAPKGHYQLSLACARLGDEAAAREHVELYQRYLKEEEERLRELRTQTDLPGARSAR
jgi:tetratricopeptide (TPR) repeat protein